MKKVIALLSATALFASVCSCSVGKSGSTSDETSSDKEHIPRTAEIIYSNSYKAELLKSDDVYSFSSLEEMPDGTWLAVGSSMSRNDGLHIYRYASDLSSYTDITPDLRKDFTGTEVYAQYCFSGSGDIFALVECSDGSNADNSSDRSGNTFCYAVYGTDGVLKSKSGSVDLSPYFDDEGMLGFRLSEAAEDGSLLMVSSELKILKINPEGKAELVYEPDSSERQNTSNGLYNTCYFFRDRDGKLILVSSGNVETESGTKTRTLFREFDTSANKPGESVYTIETSTSGITERACGGRGDYRLVYPEAEGLFGVRDNGEAEPILKWADCDLASMPLAPYGEEDYIGYFRNNGNGKSSGFYRLTPYEEGEGTETKLLTYTVIGNTIMYERDKFSAINSGRDDYRFQLKSYDGYNAENDWNNTGAYEQYKRDIITGDAPDIIITSDYDLIQTLAGKGAYADLSKFMENDPDVNRETLLPNVIEALEDNEGRIYALPLEFCVETLLVKKKYGQRENWTMDEMIEFFDNAPASADQLYNNNERVFMLNRFLTGMDSLIDYDKAECHFDSEEFIKMLKFVGRFIEKLDSPDKLSDPEGHSNYYADKATWWANDRALFKTVEFGYDNDIRYVRDIEAGEDVMFAGYPSENGSGGKLDIRGYFAILNTCPDKEGAWQFVRSFLTEEFQGELPDEDIEAKMGYLKNIVCYSPRRDVFEKQMDNTMFMYEYDAEKGEVVQVDSKPEYRLGRSYYPLTKEERDDYERYILSCKTIEGSYSTEVRDICWEEASAYFAGDCTAEQAAEMIQNRCSILVSEQS